MPFRYSQLPLDDCDSPTDGELASPGEDSRSLRSDSGVSRLTDDELDGHSVDRLGFLVRAARNSANESMLKRFLRACKGGTIAAIVMFCLGLVAFAVPLKVLLADTEFQIDMSVDSFRVPDHLAVTRVHMLEHAVREIGKVPTMNLPGLPLPTRTPAGVSPNFSPRFKRSAVGSYAQPLSQLRLLNKNIQRKKRTVARATKNINRCEGSDVRQLASLILLASVGGVVSDSADMFRTDRLQTAADIEARLKARSDVVGTTKSVLRYFQDGQSLGDAEYVKAALKANRASLMRQGTYLDATSLAVNSSSRFLRIRVALQCGDREAMLKAFQSLCEGNNTNTVTVIYGSNQLFDLQVREAFWSDVQRAWVSLALIGILMLTFTSASFWLTLWGLGCIGASFAMALAVYFHVASFKSLGILNGAGLFLILGVGIDDVLVFISVYQQCHASLSPNDKVVHTIKTAGKTTFQTSFTTAAAFTGNIVSPIRALSQFGVFMTSVVLSCWLFILLIMPLVLLTWDYFWIRMRRFCLREHTHALQHCRPSSLGKGCALKLPQEVMRAPLSADKQAGSGATRCGSRSEEIPDVPMLQLMSDDPLQDVSDSDVAPLFSSDQTNCAGGRGMGGSEGSDEREDAGIIQYILYKVTSSLVRGKWVVLGLFLAVLAASWGMDSQLSVSTEPLQLFHNGSNLQLWNDFQDSLKRQDVPCDSCSGDLFDLDDGFPLVPPISPSASSPPPFTPTSTHQPYTAPSSAPSSSSAGAITPNTRPPPVTTANLPHFTRFTPPPKPSQWTPPTGGIVPDVPIPPSLAGTTSIPNAPAQRPASLPLAGGGHTLPPHPTSVTPPPTDANMAHQPTPPGQGKTTPTEGKALEKDVVRGHAVVYVVFGIKGLVRNEDQGAHVLEKSSDESVIYDGSFSQLFNLTTALSSTQARLSLQSVLGQLCSLCKEIALDNNLVQPDGADCFRGSLQQYLPMLAECQDLPHNGAASSAGSLSATGGKLNTFTALAAPTPSGNGILWISFAFKSKTRTGGDYYQGFRDYEAWEAAMDKYRANISAELQSVFQTSPFWEEVIREVASVNSAVYSLGFSILVSAWSVAVFMAHPGLLLIVMTTIIAEVSLVVAIFWMMGWTLGPVEAICLSILVGTAVDYCVHVTEAYLLVGKNLPARFKLTGTSGAARSWRAVAAVTHIGTPVLGSAITTAVTALPLTKATIVPFASFGVIVLVNTCVSATYSLGVLPFVLASVAPARWTSRVCWHAVSTVVATVLAAGTLVAVYLLSMYGVIALPLGSISAN